MTGNTETQLRSALARTAQDMPVGTPAPGRVVAGARARRRRAVLARAGTGIAAAGVAAVALTGLPGAPATPVEAGRQPAPSQVASGPARTGQFALVLAATPQAPALARVGRYDLTWLPPGLQPDGPAVAQAIERDPSTGRSGTGTLLHLTTGGVPHGPTADGSPSLTVAVAEGLVKDRADLDRFLAEPGTVGRADGQRIERGTVGGAPAYLVEGRNGVEIVFVPDERSGLVVDVKGSMLDRATVTRVVEGLRLRR